MIMGRQTMAFKLTILLTIFLKSESSADLHQDGMRKHRWLFSPEGPKYIFDISKVTEWDIGQSACIRYGGEGLVRILGEATNNFISEEFDSKRQYWIGLYRRNPEASFKWWNQTKVGFSALDSDAHGNKGKDCVAFVASSWKPAKCSTALSSLCESKSPSHQLVITIDGKILSGIVLQNTKGDINVQCQVTEDFTAASNLSLECGSKRVDGWFAVSQTLQADNRIDNPICVCTVEDSEWRYQAAVKFDVTFPPELLTTRMPFYVEEGSNVTAELTVMAAPVVTSCLIERIEDKADGYTCLIHSLLNYSNMCKLTITIINVSFTGRSSNGYQVMLQNGIEPGLTFNLTVMDTFGTGARKLSQSTDPDGLEFMMNPSTILGSFALISFIGFVVIGVVKLKQDPSEAGEEGWFMPVFDSTLDVDPTAFSVEDEEQEMEQRETETLMGFMLKRSMTDGFILSRNHPDSEDPRTLRPRDSTSSDESDTASSSSDTD